MRAQGQVVAQDTLTVTGVPGVRLTGVVQSDDGEPLAGVPVSIAQIPWAGSTRLPNLQYDRQVSTGSDGRFEAFVAPDSLQVTVGQRDTRWGSAIQSVRSMGDALDLRFALARRCALRGVVRDARGAPVAGLPISARPAQRDLASAGSGSSGSTEADGSFELWVLPGQYTLAAAVGLRTPGAYFPSQQLGQVVVEADRIVDLVVRPGVAVTVQLQGAGGAPVPGVLVYATDAAGLAYAQGVATGSDGRATLRVLPGTCIVQVPVDSNGGYGVRLLPDTYRVTLSSSDVALAGQSLDTVQVAGDATLDFPVQPCVQVTVSLVDVQGQPLLLADRRLIRIWLVGASRGASPLGVLQQSAAGTWAGRVLRGVYALRLEPSDGLHARQQMGTLQVAGDTAVVLVARSGVRLAGRVTASDGMAVPNASLSFSLPDGIGAGSGATMTASDGS
ncbi:MAG: carboxypeptidase-like regulatory domain-containing protein [Candidatus Latescibacterota bacterium]